MVACSVDVEVEGVAATGGDTAPLEQGVAQAEGRTEGESEPAQTPATPPAISSDSPLAEPTATAEPDAALPPIDADAELRLEHLVSRRWAPTRPDVDCDVVTDDIAAAEQAVREAGPDAVICLTGEHVSRFRVEVSGLPEAPVRVIGTDASVAGVDLIGDHVELAGFDVGASGSETAGDRLGPAGIQVDGEGLTVSGNRVVSPGGHGITCGVDTGICDGVSIVDNLVRGADGTGIMIFGTGTTVARNEVTESVRVNANDADGIRFFGAGHHIVDNLVHALFDRGYDGEGPHTDCFQTFDNSKPPTVDVIIERNVCFDADHQCLIATAQESGRAGEIGRSGRLIFRNNVCASNGSQAILLQEFPGVEITNNLFLDTNLTSAIVAHSGSSDATVINNVFIGELVPYEADASSSGLFADHNLHQNAGERSPVRTEPNGKWRIDAGFSGDGEPGMRFVPGPASPLLDAGLRTARAGDTDLTGGPRIVDGDGDGDALPDVGPFEVAGP